MVAHGFHLDGRLVADAGGPVLAVRRVGGQVIANPAGDLVLAEGDTVLVLAAEPVDGAGLSLLSPGRGYGPSGPGTPSRSARPARRSDRRSSSVATDGDAGGAPVEPSGRAGAAEAER